MWTIKIAVTCKLQKVLKSAIHRGSHSEVFLRKDVPKTRRRTLMVKCDFNKVAKQLYCEFGYIYWKSPQWKTLFFVQWRFFSFELVLDLAYTSWNTLAVFAAPLILASAKIRSSCINPGSLSACQIELTS